MIDAQFAELQAKLRAQWPHVTLRSIGDVERTIVVVHSLGLDIPEQLAPVMEAVIRERALTPLAGETPLVPEPASTFPRLRGATALVAAPLFAAPQVA